MVKVCEGFGVIKTILISDDVYNNLTHDEIKHLEAFTTGSVSWVIYSDRKSYINFYYDYEPMVS